jgi:lambda family phage portal protein
MAKSDNIKPSLTERLSASVDNVVQIFSPQAAAKRKYFRYISRKMFGSYRGAEIGRLRGSWLPGGGSADEDLLPNLDKLRERSRDLVRNDGIASGAIDTVVTNIIGSGIRPQSRFDKESLKIDEEYAEKLQRKIEKIWNLWVPYADAGNRMNFYELEELSERQRFVNGESIIIPVRIMDKRRPYSYALQIVESDRMDTPSDYKSNKNIRDGIEIGKFGEAMNYWIKKTHPGDYSYSGRSGNGSDSYVKYPAFDDLGVPNIFHLYHLKRPGQSRGEPFFAPVINLFKDRFEYMEAELVAARVAACFAVFIKKNDPTGSMEARSTETDGKRIEELSPALIEYLNTGEEIQSFNPNRPGGTFGLFIERILRDVSAGMGLPYEVVAKDFSRSNYSNTRAALLEARRFFMMQQRFVSDKLGQPVYAAVFEEAYLRGELDILDFYENRAAYVRANWITPGWQWVDPESEVKASVESIDNNLSNLAEESAAHGRDWEEALEQRAREKKKIQELEVKFGISLSAPEKASPVVKKPSKRKTDDEGSQKEPPAGEASRKRVKA